MIKSYNCSSGTAIYFHLLYFIIVIMDDKVKVPKSINATVQREIVEFPKSFLSYHIPFIFIYM